jgi:hypothetical protein
VEAVRTAVVEGGGRGWESKRRQSKLKEPLGFFSRIRASYSIESLLKKRETIKKW